MSKDPVFAPQLTGKGVGVLQVDRTDTGLADMSDDVERFDRVALDQIGHLRFAGGVHVEKRAAALALKKGDAPVVAVVVGQTTTAAEALEGETDIGRDSCSSSLGADT